MMDWRDKADEDLTPEDIAEMRRLAMRVALSGPDVRLSGGQLVTVSPTYVHPVVTLAPPQSTWTGYIA